ncbi:hypothetical protein [Curtobacterium sp. MCBD17_032]|uniref:hypothetical protein n=1 Tax=Curtobacterium sp. MCBD17_032 TaxID=2175659 RepID=UPI000DA93C0D|nr:hypothetical protein [Curtobacterium sp. MCBD17_032]PZE84082.1 hypothetical protein DEI91_09270 [Curtobacterium sp. MCBD17_032]
MLGTMGPEGQTDRCWRAAAPSDAFWAWVADRGPAAHDHLVDIAEVGRDETGALVVRVAVPTGLALPAALDRIGSPTPGVAVTLTLPLLEVALLADAGAVLLGSARLEDVVVDDAGAVVLVDRPPGADGPLPAGSSHGAEALVLAVRAVWDRVDPRGDGVAGPGLAGIDERCAAARTRGGAALVELERAVRAAAPPRPVRWDPPPLTYAFGARTGDAMAIRGSSGEREPGTVDRLLVACRDVLTTGVPVCGRRVGVRALVTAGVVVAGLVLAGVTGGRT